MAREFSYERRVARTHLRKGQSLVLCFTLRCRHGVAIALTEPFSFNQRMDGPMEEVPGKQEEEEASKLVEEVGKPEAREEGLASMQEQGPTATVRPMQTATEALEEKKIQSVS